MLPPRQRLTPHHSARPQVYYGLVMGNNLASFDGGRNLTFELNSLSKLAIHFLMEKTIVASACTLRLIQSHVGLAHRGLGRAAVLSRQFIQLIVVSGENGNPHGHPNVN